MKKRELVLDFTSLLDVILILLFIIITNMNQVSITAGEEAERALNNAKTKITELAGVNEELLAKLDEAGKKDIEHEALQAEIDELQAKYAELQDEYDYLKITTGYDAEDVSVYLAAIEKTTHVVLLCETGVNQITGNHEVKIDIYIETEDDGQPSYADSVVLVHDFSLSKQEREKFSADQVVEMTRALSAVLRGRKCEMAWVSIQYAYDDANFARSDLDIINKALENIERSFSIPCYAEELKMY